jgi:opacity protein-like surface antigen
MNAFAQESFNAGMLAGINASQVRGDNYSGFDKAGLLVGLFSNIDVSQNINLQFELNYSQKGSRRNPKTDEGDTDFFLMRMHYIEIPVMARTDYKRFKFEAGAYYSQLIDYYLEDENGPFDIDPELNQFNNNDIGLLAGVYFQFTDNLVMNWRYSNSIVDFREFHSGGRFLFNTGMFHQYMSISLRYVFYGQQ